MKRKWVLPVLLALSVALLVFLIEVVAASGSGYLTRLTIASDPGRESFGPSLSADGKAVVFSSDSDLLGQGIPDEQLEVWLYDTATMTYTRVTTASEAGRTSYDSSLSADGTVVGFSSNSDFLGQGIPDNQREIWLYRTATMTYTRVTTAPRSGRDSMHPSLSGDGAVVAFASDSDLLGQGIQDSQTEIWLYDTATMTLTRVTAASHANRDSRYPSLSAGGTIVAFESDSDLLGQGIPDGQSEIWLYNTATMTYTPVTTASAVGRSSYRPSLSADGSAVAFESDSDFLGQGIPDEQSEIWLFDRATMTYTRVTTASHADRDSHYPSLSASGKVVAFQSDSDFLDDGIPQYQSEIWLYDTATMTYTRVTTASSYGRDSHNARLSADGLTVAFQSDSDFLSQGIPDEQREIWLYGPSQHRVYLPLVMRAYPHCIAAGEVVWWDSGDRCCAGLSGVLHTQPCDSPGVGGCQIDGCFVIPPCACSTCAPCGDGICQSEYRENRCSCPSDCN